MGEQQMSSLTDLPHPITFTGGKSSIHHLSDPSQSPKACNNTKEVTRLLWLVHWSLFARSM